MKTIIATTQAPAAIGPYSQAVQANGLLFCSGQIALRPDGSFVDGDAAAQTEQILQNLKAVLAEAGLTFEDVVKTTIYLTDINDFAAVNEVYGSVFVSQPPARATVEVSNLPKGAKVEIEMIAAA
jgi:2-iminobutanoate/2-iminopropanoate deaminase